MILQSMHESTEKNGRQKCKKFENVKQNKLKTEVIMLHDNLRIVLDNDPSHTRRRFSNIHAHFLFQSKPQTERAALRDSTGLTKSLSSHTLYFHKGKNSNGNKAGKSFSRNHLDHGRSLMRGICKRISQSEVSKTVTHRKG